MASPIHDERDAIDPAAARMVAKVRLMMLISGLTTFGAVAIVIGVIAYKLMRVPDPVVAAPTGQAIEEMVALPAGAKVVSTAVADGRIVVTLDIGGGTDIRTYDLRTFKPTGRLRLAPQP